MPGPLAAYTKASTALLDYGVDWGTSWLDSTGSEILSTSNWVIPAGLTSTNDTYSTVTGITTVWLSGGSTGEDYDCVNIIETSAGRRDARTIAIRVRDR